MNARRCSLALAALLLAIPAPALAQGGQDDAKRAFELGRELYTAGKVEAALVELQTALRLSGSPNARLLVARCLKDLGRTPEAYEALRRTSREAAELAKKDPKYEPTRDAAASLLATIEPEVAKLVIVLPAELQSAEVRVGSRVVERDQLGEPVAVAPGAIEVTASLEGAVRATKRTQAQAGGTTTVVLEAASSGPSGPTPGDPGSAKKPIEQTKEESMGPVRVAGIVIGSFGLAALTSAAVTGGLALDRKATLDEECGGRCPDDSHADLIADGRAFQLGTNVGLGIGAGLVTAGVFMVAFGQPSEPESAAPTVAVGPLSLALSWRLR